MAPSGRSFSIALVLAVFFVGFISSSLNSQSTAYAVDGLSNSFVAIDLATGAVTMLGSTTANGQGGDYGPLFQSGFYTIQDGMLVQVFAPTGLTFPVGPITGLHTGQVIVGLAYYHLGATMYMATTNPGSGESELYTLDLTTAAATFITVITNAPFLVSIAIDCIGNLYGIDATGDNLVRINRTTGAGTILGPLGVDVSETAQDADWDPFTNTLYWTYFNGVAAELRTVNVDTVSSSTVFIWNPYYFISFGIFAGECLNTGLEDGPTGVPAEFALQQNFPNPFNPTTTIAFSVPQSEHVTLKIYNVEGQEVAELVNHVLAPGNYRFEWDASSISSGTYFYKLTAGKFSAIKKMLLLK